MYEEPEKIARFSRIMGRRKGEKELGRGRAGPRQPPWITLDRCPEAEAAAQWLSQVPRRLFGVEGAGDGKGRS